MTRYGLGVVTDPEPGHEQFVGRLCIPYVTPTGIVDLRFRCIEHVDCKQAGHKTKYLGLPGARPHLFNVRSLASMDTLVITEGELDAIAVEIYTEIPAIGVPGATQWGRHKWWKYCFESFDTGLFIVCDGDEAGIDQFGRALANDLPNATMIALPDGEDSNSLLAKQGGPAFLRRLGLGGFD